MRTTNPKNVGRCAPSSRNLLDRQGLALIQEDVVAEIGRRKQRAALTAVLKDTATNRITTKSSEVAEQLVTNALRAKFSQEIDKFGVARLAVEMHKEKTRQGVPYFRVRMIRQPDANVGAILSEGEHRCVALAAFLAELATTESRSAIVFDDPVSSLDHVHREAVANRLAEVGKHRQVIILTHDIAFLFLLDQACREGCTHVAFRSVTRTDDHAGFVQQDPPARAQPIDKVIESMQKQLDNEKCLHENGDHDKWERTVDALQKRLRWTWERAVEEAVGPVIKRLSNKVETKGLAKVTALKLEDCIEMRKAYGRCSTLLHSSADALNTPLPDAETIQKEITAPTRLGHEHEATPGRDRVVAMIPLHWLAKDQMLSRSSCSSRLVGYIQRDRQVPTGFHAQIAWRSARKRGVEPRNRQHRCDPSGDIGEVLYLLGRECTAENATFTV